MSYIRFTVADKLTGWVLFAMLFMVFWLSPVTQVTDAKFALLLSHSLWHQHTFTYDHYNFPPSDIGVHATGVLYQLHQVNGHIYYILPVGTSILSVPFVRVAEAFGLSTVNSDGTYNEQQERQLQRMLAACLMAALGITFFFTARLKLTFWLSVIIALGGALGTSIWSTASRGMWAHTWSALLWGVAAFLLVRAEARGTRPNPLLLATILSWTYFTRPTNAIGIIAVTIYVLFCYRSIFVSFAVTGGAWFALFLYWSHSHFGAFFPEYYQAGRLDFSVFGTALAGQLISPGRGLLVYTPVLFFLVYLLVLVWRSMPSKPLAILALACIGGQLFSAAAYPHWWGGSSYGPRFLTESTVWFVCLAILAFTAKPNWRAGEVAVGTLLLGLSLFMNGRGAISWDTWQWNSTPDGIDRTPHRLWSWRQPPFLAGLLYRPLPEDVPKLFAPATIDLTAESASPMFWYGWSGPEPGCRWSNAREAAIIFQMSPPAAISLSLSLSPFLAPPRLMEQNVSLELNGLVLDKLRLTTGDRQTYSFALQREWLAATPNILKFHLPDAASPASFNDVAGEGDQRLLSICVDKLELSVR